MDFQYYDLRYRHRGETVKVMLSGNAANVQLMDSSNFQNYRNGRDYRYYGGYAHKSPFLIEIPRSGYWYVTIDLGGHAGTIRSSVDVIPVPH